MALLANLGVSKVSRPSRLFADLGVSRAKIFSFQKERGRWGIDPTGLRKVQANVTHRLHSVSSSLLVTLQAHSPIGSNGLRRLPLDNKPEPN